MKTSTFVLAGLFAIIVAAGTGCAKKEDAGTNPTAGLLNIMSAVGQDFAPESLDYETPQAALASGRIQALQEAADAQGPCAGLPQPQLFNCQPVLLRIYITMAKFFLDTTKQIVQGTGESLTNLAVGASGSATAADGQTIHFSRSSEDSYRILVETSLGMAAYIDVTGATARMQMDFSKMANDDENAPEALDVIVDFTDESHWNVTAFVKMACNESDVRAPRNFWVNMSKDGTVWKGKATIYNPVWAQFSSEPTCSTADDDSLAVNFYTDFVGDDVAAKVNVHMVPRTETSFTNFSSRGMDQMCSTFPVLNCGGAGWDLSAFANPFCNPASTDTALWGNACSGVSSAVAAAEFGPATDWIVPSLFHQKTVTLPASL